MGWSWLISIFRILLQGSLSPLSMMLRQEYRLASLPCKELIMAISVHLFDKRGCQRPCNQGWFWFFSLSLYNLVGRGPWSSLPSSCSNATNARGSVHKLGDMTWIIMIVQLLTCIDLCWYVWLQVVTGSTDLYHYSPQGYLWLPALVYDRFPYCQVWSPGGQSPLAFIITLHV